MKVLEISHLYPVPYDPLLGIAIHKQLKYFNNKNCEVLVVSPIPWTPFPFNVINDKWKLYSKIPFYQPLEDIEIYYPRYLTFPNAYFFNSSGIRMYHGIRKLISEIWKKFPFDLIHAHMALPDGYAAMLLSQNYGKPFVVTFQATDLDITTKRSNYCFISLKKVFSKSNKIISPSPRLQKDLLDNFGLDSDAIPYGIDNNEIFTSGKNSSFSEKSKSTILLSVSRLIKTKGIDLNLYAFKKLLSKYDDLIYLIIGKGPMQLHLENLAKELKIEKKVKFIGFLPHKKIMQYMFSCDIFVLPSWQETLGLVYIEAMAHGKPVIGVKGQGIDGIVEHKRNGMLVEPKDIDSLVEMIAYLIDHPQEAKKMGERAKKLVLENYTWEKNAEKTIKIYKEILRKTHN